MTRVSFWLPTPPSTNALFIVRGRKRVVAKEYRAWKSMVATGLSLCKSSLACQGPVELHFDVAENNRRDLDNFLKPLCDILVECGLIESDRCATVRKITIEWSETLDDGVQVTIAPATAWKQRRGAASAVHTRRKSRED